MFGYMGKVLRINLEREKIAVENLKEEIVKKFIGGRGFGAWTLWSELLPRIPPLSRENKLLITLGPMTGTTAQGAHKWIAQFKSPLTGTYFRSVGGGFFGAELKFAGYDALIIEGRARKPTYLFIHDDTVEFRDAQKIWGMITSAATDFLLDETEERAKLITIGPAGEKLVKFASIITDDRRTASRGGGGAIMGSKNLKAIVVKGEKKPEIFNREAFEESVKCHVETLRKSPSFNFLRSLGTDSAVFLEYLNGCFPTFNYRQKELPGCDVFNAENLSRYVVKHYGCYSCILRCGKIFKVTDGPYAGTVWDMPEYEAHWAFGSNLGNTNVESVIFSNMLADLYGLDVISCGVAIGLAIELYEKGVIDRRETDGVELRWGDPDAIPEMTRKIALRIGFGNILAEGVRKAAEIIGRGAERYAMHVKGLELPGHDPRRAKSRGLSFATSPIGASHTIGGGVKYEERGLPYKGRKIDPFATQDKGEITFITQNENAAIETGIWCLFVDMTPETYSNFLYYATGFEEFKEPRNLMLIGERIFNLERAFNIREGIAGYHDKMPERIVKEPVARASPSKGQIFEEEILLKDYYKVCGWNEKGIPSREKLKELSMEDVAEQLYR